MKQLLIMLTGFLTVLSVHGQLNKVTITVNGNKNLQLAVDGVNHSLYNSNVSANKTTLVLSNLEAGQHGLQFTRTQSKTEVIPTIFNLRKGYDMDVTVNTNGSIELIEKRRAGISTGQTPMSNASFTTLLRNVKMQQPAGAKRTAIANAFNNTGNYFTSSQAVQLLQTVTAQNNRLELAKLSYRSITDPDNFYLVSNLLNTQAGRDELAAYIDTYEDNGGIKVAMTDANFNTLYQGIKGQWPVSAQLNSLTNAFNNTSNYFTTYQAGQLIQIVTAESSRLQVAKLSYRSITDPTNFSQLYDLFNTQASVDELKAYVNNNGDGITNAMTDANFNTLYTDIKKQWPVSAQVNSLTTAFNNASNYFTTNQASQLIQIVVSESSRLQLAKLSYKRIIDPANFSQLYNLLNSQASRDELAAYVNNNYSDNVNVPMTEASFNTLYETIRKQFLPYEQMNSLTTVFNTTGNYFTTAQVKQLIPLVSLESNRLKLAKLSYRTVTDRANFSQLYDILNSQASMNELDAYVKVYKE